MAEFTPGPWHWDGEPRNNDPDYLIENSPWLVTPESYFQVLRGEIECSEADANLIAAAPDLYEALKDAHRYLFSEDGPDEVDRGELATEIEAAIAKAEGRSNG